MLDEPHPIAELLARAPREVGRVDRDAVAADARAGPERLIAEWLGGGRVQGLPDVDPEVLGHHRQLVDERDVHLAVGVLDQLGHLGLARARGDRDRMHDRRVERHRQVATALGQPAHDLRRVLDLMVALAGVDPLGGVAEREVDAGNESAGFEDRAQVLLRRARPRGGLEDDQHPGAQLRGDRGRGVADHRQVGSAIGQGRRQAKHDDVRGCQRARVVRIRDPVQRGQLRGKDIGQIGAPGAERGDLGRVGVESDRRVAGAPDRNEQRQADVAQPDHRDDCLALADRACEPFEWIEVWWGNEVHRAPAGRTVQGTAGVAGAATGSVSQASIAWRSSRRIGSSAKLASTAVRAIAARSSSSSDHASRAAT